MFASAVPHGIQAMASPFRGRFRGASSLRTTLAALPLILAASQAHAAIEVAKVDDDELTCEQIAAEVKKMDGIAASGSADAKAAAQRKARLEALAKATKCKL